MRIAAWAAFRLAIFFSAIFFFQQFLSSPSCDPSGEDQKETSTSEEGYHESLPQKEEKKELEGAMSLKLKEELKISARTISQLSENEYLFEGDVDMFSGHSRIQADRIYMNNDEEKCLAEGSVLLDWKGNRLAGDRLEFDMKTENGAMRSVLGYIEPEYLFKAQEVEKIAEDKVVIHKGIFTSCTQPTPYWSFKISRALIHLDHYAHLRHIIFKVKKIPLLYLPYMVWPVKEDRSAGFLFPEIGSTKRRGKVMSEAFFWPIRRNMDMTIYADYYSLAGLATGLEYHFIPNDKGRGQFLGYYLKDKVTNSRRYRLTYSQEQDFRNGFRLNAEVNKISDFNYYTDFERELKFSSRPYSLSRVDLSRNWSYYSLNFRGEWREQRLGLGKLIQSQLPEIELRGRNQKLWNSPFYFSFETSFINFSKETTRQDIFLGEVTSYQADYLRYDLSSVLSLPYSPFPWLDLNLSAKFRETFYTKRLDPKDPFTVLNKSLNRFLSGGSIEIIGPKFYRIYDRPNSKFSPRYKHTIEPRMEYSYVPAFDRQGEVPKFDEIDYIGGGNLISFFLRHALYAKRPSGPSSPPQKVEEPSSRKEAHSAPEGMIGEERKDKDEKSSEEETIEIQEGKNRSEEREGEDYEKKRERALNPVEIATLEISQRYSLDSPLSFGKGQSKKYSPIQATFRFNPTRNYSFDLRTSYDVIFQTLRNLSISASFRKEEGSYLTLSMVRMKGFEGASNQEQATFEGGTRLFHQKLSFHVKLSYNISKSFLPEQRYRIEYNTQCCGFYFEYLNRDFSFNERREYRFAIDLKGIGKVIDFHHGYTE